MYGFKRAYEFGFQFDGMRKHLVQDFDEICVLGLGGNVRKNAKLSGTTHNDSWIHVGVRINIFVRKPGGPRRIDRRLIYEHQNCNRTWRRRLRMSHPDVDKDYYSILGAGETASQDEIERLYKRLARRHHPDRGGDAEEMKAINEAYGVLGNDATRCAYDAQRPPHRKPLSAHASSLSSPPALLENTASGRLAGAMFYLMAGLLFLFLLRFYYIRFLWPLFVVAAFLVMVGVLKIHAALVYAREGVASSHPMRRYVWMQEMAFWLIVCVCVYGIYLMLRAI